jgi:RimJ/RimL family protein N-acetyltransferase
MAAEHWPFFDLRIRTDRVVLRPDWDAGLEELATVAAGGIHDPATMPFGEPWSDAEPGGDLERGVLRWSWRHRAELTPEKWQINFLVCLDDRVVGSQGLGAEQFAKRRVVRTGSWLGQPFQGKGIGKEMRAAVLSFAFDGLGATEALSAAFHDNAASLAVSRGLGYLNNGEHIELRRGEPDRMIELVLTRQAWEAHRWPERIELAGVEDCLPLLGVSGPGGLSVSGETPARSP